MSHTWQPGPSRRRRHLHTHPTATHIYAWLEANKIDPRQVPIDATIIVRNGNITIDVYRRRTDGQTGAYVDAVGQIPRDKITVPLIAEIATHGTCGDVTCTGSGVATEVYYSTRSETRTETSVLSTNAKNLRT